MGRCNKRLDMATLPAHDTIGSVRSIGPKDHVVPRTRYVDPNSRRGRTSRRPTSPIDATPETTSKAAIPSAWSKTVRLGAAGLLRDREAEREFGPTAEVKFIAEAEAEAV